MPTSGTRFSPMATVKLKYVYRSKDRQGRDRWLLRMPGRPAVTLKGAYGSPEFMAAYQAALSSSSSAKPAATPKAGTIAALVHLYFGNIRFAGTRHETQVSRRRLLERFAKDYGDKRVASLGRDHIQAPLDRRTGQSW